jgi:hypothetical protein
MLHCPATALVAGVRPEIEPIRAVAQTVISDDEDGLSDCPHS